MAITIRNINGAIHYAYKNLAEAFDGIDRSGEKFTYGLFMLDGVLYYCIEEGHTEAGTHTDAMGLEEIENGKGDHFYEYVSELEGLPSENCLTIKKASVEN